MTSGRLFDVAVMAVALATLLPRPVRAEVIDRVVAVVAGEVIMQTDLTAARDLGLMPDRAALPSPVSRGASGGSARAAGAPPLPDAGSDGELRRILNQLVDRALMLAEVERYAPPEPADADVDAAVQRVRVRFPDEAAFQQALARSGIDVEYVRGTVRQNLRIRAYLEQRFVVVAPTEQELADFYRDNASRFVADGRQLTFDEARPIVSQLLTEERRSRLLAEWLEGLRRRADTLILY